jgi:hypothetical protein
VASMGEVMLSSKPLNFFDISGYEERFHDLEKELPRRGPVGYIADDSSEPGISDGRLLACQYSLSPVILVRSLEYDIIIGNFRTAHDPGELGLKGPLIREDFGSGLVLFRRVRR